ncbi:MAG: MerR family transcriptional regulator [Lachnospiraceae bacterium]|nr:MerR family transcriptional regulator [Lachnospiraceae bacterium]
MRTVHEVSKLTGISVRTLHHYDAIGLLKPTQTTESGYRLYDDSAIRRLQNILIFRELQFPLKEIKEILDSPAFDPTEALSQQIKLLELRQKHIEKLIILAREIQSKGVTTMNFEVFDKSEIEQYKAEAKAKWGKTQAYQDYTQKSATQSEDEQNKITNQLLGKFSELGALRHLPPAAKKVQEKISVLQKFITDNCYVCTNEILNGLGQMYVGDERFKKNIDKAGGDGTAEFVSQAISVYCSR